MTEPTALSTIISADAKIGMDEMVNVFLVKYETDLYDRKHELKDIIKLIDKEIDVHVKSVGKSFNWDKWKGLGIPELKIVTSLANDHKWDWAGGKVTMDIQIKSENSYQVRNAMSHTVEQKIPKAAIAKRQRLLDDKDERQAQLSDIVQKITDMSRKERQVKGRISEKRLQEAGLTEFMEGSDMQKMLSIDS